MLAGSGQAKPHFKGFEFLVSRGMADMLVHEPPCAALNVLKHWTEADPPLNMADAF
jgi:hypothetical protein